MIPVDWPDTAATMPRSGIGLAEAGSLRPVARSLVKGTGPWPTAGRTTRPSGQCRAPRPRWWHALSPTELQCTVSERIPDLPRKVRGTQRRMAARLSIPADCAVVDPRRLRSGCARLDACRFTCRLPRPAGSLRPAHPVPPLPRPQMPRLVLRACCTDVAGVRTTHQRRRR